MIDLADLRAQFPSLEEITPLASGGQKEVCRAMLNGKPVALKLVLPLAGAEDRTTRELKAVRDLSSAYIPRVYESGTRILLGQKRYYLVEEFVDGHTYRTILNSEPVREFSQVLELTKVLLSAAADFERMHLVHRDIKPENIMLDRDGKFWVLDLGIARHLTLSSLTPNGGFGIGTIGYAPPEQYRNLKSEIDSRADLFAIGMVVHESLSGYHFYLRGSPDALAVIHKMDKVDLPRLALPEDPTNEFADFVASLCQRFPSRRPKSAVDALGWYEPIYSRLNAGI